VAEERKDFDGQPNTQTNQPYIQAYGAISQRGTITFDHSYNH